MNAKKRRRVADVDGAGNAGVDTAKREGSRPPLDIKNVSCGNLTSDRGRRGRRSRRRWETGA